MCREAWRAIARIPGAPLIFLWKHADIVCSQRLYIRFNDTHWRARAIEHTCVRRGASCTGAWQQNFGVAESLRSINTVTKVNKQPQPASISLSRSLSLSLRLPPRHPTGRWGFSGEHDTARLQVTDMSHHLKPCGTIIPLSLWRQKGRGGDGGSVVGNGGSRGGKEMVGTEREWVRGEVEGVRARWCWWMLYSRLIQRDSPRDASRSSNKALLFFLFFFPWVLLGVLQSNPLGPQSSPSAIWGCLRKFFSQILGLFQCWCFKWILQCCCGHAEGLLGE